MSAVTRGNVSSRRNLRRRNAALDLANRTLTRSLFPFSELVVPKYEGVHSPGGREHRREAAVGRVEQDVLVVDVDVVAIERQGAAAVAVRR